MRVIVITGPTASGKSALAVRVARRLRCEIISADSRQIYRHMLVTTAVPTEEERGGVPHHLLEFLEPTEYYSAAMFEADAMRLIGDMERRGLRNVVVAGGSMMYIDALLHGLDNLPTISEAVRRQTLEFYDREGLEGVRARLAQLDPAYMAQADPNNARRLIHALEIIAESGCPVSQLRTGQRKVRPFQALKVAIEWPREQLFARINRRVEQMAERGMEAEARALLPLRGCNALNTVGFKELFAMMDGRMTRREALDRIAKNTRVYAKKQMTWLKREPAEIILRPRLTIEP